MKSFLILFEKQQQESLKTLFGVMDPELVGKFLAEAL